MTRWMHPPELERGGVPQPFDPVVEGAQFGLAREVSLALWEQACASATDSAGRVDVGDAQRRFRALAAGLAARGGRLASDVGRVTRVEGDGGRSRSRGTD